LSAHYEAPLDNSWKDEDAYRLFSHRFGGRGFCKILQGLGITINSADAAVADSGW
jgi:hypothetical protein